MPLPHLRQFHAHCAPARGRTVMPAAAPQPTTQPGPQPSRSGRLLSIIRKLIDYGTALAARVRQRIAADPSFARTSFGTADLAVIFARIARGLHLAQALEARVLRRAAWLDQGPRPRTARPAPKPSETHCPMDRRRSQRRGRRHGEVRSPAQNSKEFNATEGRCTPNCVASLPSRCCRRDGFARVDRAAIKPEQGVRAFAQQY